MYKKSEWYFFDQGFIDGKSAVKMEKGNLLVAGLKFIILNLQKVSFLISSLSQGGAFEL